MSDKEEMKKVFDRLNEVFYCEEIAFGEDGTLYVADLRGTLSRDVEGHWLNADLSLPTVLYSEFDYKNDWGESLYQTPINLVDGQAYTLYIGSIKYVGFVVNDVFLCVNEYGVSDVFSEEYINSNKDIVMTKLIEA